MCYGYFNTDIYLDVAVCQYNNSSINVFYGNGDGSFSTASNFPTAIGPEGIVTGDFNGDGFPDIATANYGSFTVSILLNNGNGTFATPTNYPLANGTVMDIVAGDFDNNGTIDLATATFNGLKFYTLSGNGNGTFQTPVAITVAYQLRGINTADFNSDNLLDIVTANYNNNSFSIFLGNGNGTFGSANTFTSGSTPHNIQFGRINNDNILDIVTANYQGTSFSVSFGVGNGSFTFNGQYTVGSFTTAITIGDFNQDSFNDIASCNYSTGNVYLRLNSGTGSFGANILYNVGSNSRHIISADFSGDNKKDIMVSRDNGGLCILESCAPPNAFFSATSNNFCSLACVGFVSGTDNTPTSWQWSFPGGTPSISTAQNPINICYNTPGTYNVQLIVSNSVGSDTLLMPNYITVSNCPQILPCHALSVVSSITNPRSGALGDFNNDNVVDLIIGNETSGDIGFLIGNPNGSFGVTSYFSVYSNASIYAVDTGDFNGDGNLDIITGNFAGNVSRLSGNGNGTFNPPINYSLTNGGPVRAVKTYDLNGDNVLDLIMASSTIISVAFGVGDGSFLTPAYYNVPAAAVSISLGDMNNDGYLDIITTGSILPGNGNGTFAPALAGPGFSDPLTVADFNGDGMLDVVWLQGSGSLYGVKLGNGNFTFNTGSTFNSGGSTPRSLTTGNFNNDPFLDIVIANADRLSFLLGTGTGLFTTAINRIFSISSPHYKLLTTDLNGDASPDFVSPDHSNNTVSVFLSKPTPTLNSNFVPVDCYGACTGTASIIASGGTSPYSYAWSPGNQTQSTATALCAGCYTVAVTDSFGCLAVSTPICITQPTDLTSSSAIVNASCYWCADGSATIIPTGGVAPYTYLWSPSGQTTSSITGLLPGNYSVCITDANGCIECDTITIVSSVNIPMCFNPAVNYSAGTGTWSTMHSDVNGDGFQDMITTADFEQDIFVRLGIGNGTFGPPSQYFCGVTPRGMDAGDLDGDGDNDVAVVNYLGSIISVLFNNGAGVFATPVTYTVNTYPMDLKFGMYNSDGFLDIAVANAATGDISILLNNGSGVFSLGGNYGATGTPLSIGNGYFNNDLYLDLVITHGPSDRISILLGSGTGAFPIENSFTGIPDPEVVDTADFNQDGNLDIVTANYLGNNVTVFFGDGTGNLSAPLSLSAGNSPQSVCTGDFNNDARADFAIANYNSGNISVFPGSGLGTFSPPINYTAGTNPYCIFSRDLNGDNIPDLSVANINGNNVSVFLSNAPGSVIVSGNDTICYGNSTTLTASGAQTYSWMPGNLTGSTVNVSPTTSTTYSITGTSVNGCSFTSSFRVTVNMAPANAGLNDTICLNGSTPLNATGGVSYSWSPTSGLSNPTISNPIAAPTITTSYTVTATDASGCTGTDVVIIYVFLCTDTKGTEKQTSLSVFPNPSSGIFSILLEQTMIEEITVLDLLGKELLNRKINAEKTELNLELYPAGIYLLNVKSSLGVIHRFIIKQ